MNLSYKYFLLIYCISIFLCPFPVFSQDEPGEIYISKIKLNNIGAVSKKEITENMATEFPSFLPWKKKPVFDEEILKEDVIRISNLYKEYGFYDVKIEYLIEQKNDDFVDVIIDIDRGEKTVVKDFVLDVKPKLLDEEYAELLDAATVMSNEDFSQREYQKTKNIIANYFSNKGYPFAEIKSEALVNREDKWAKVDISVNRGYKYYFGTVSIKGNKDIDDKIISREILYKSGDEYSLTMLDRTRLAIFGLGYFKSVVIDPVFNEEQKVVDTVINVEQRKLGSVKVGVGFGTEDLFRGQIIWNHKNLFGGARDLEVSGKFSFLTQRLSASLIQPYLFDRDMDFISTLSTSRDDFPSYTSESLNFSNKIKKKIYNNINFYSSFDIQLSRLSEISGSTSDFVEDDGYFLTFLSAGLDHSTVDNPLNPTSGRSLSFNIESSLGVLGSDEDFITSVLEFIGYKEYKNIVFAKRLDIGLIQPFGSTDSLDVPIFKRFFTGGSTTMRGFPFQELGPLDSGSEPVGGNTLLLGNLEGRFPIYKKLGGVLFFDYGNVFPDEFDFDFGEIKYAVGTGLRFDTIIGPLRVDFGYTLNPEPEIDRFQFFLSIGHAF
ncbi:MAG TPA: BamA/TamA family outer membrane protein [Thermodesulfobacteriota bacterium]|nr:BamA/TamA family outer membrane protein [Thermodesulfobacteriota bacterium]